MNTSSSLMGLGCNCGNSLRGYGMGDVINTTGVKIGDILKLKKPVVVTVSGQSSGLIVPADSVFVNAPVSKITNGAIFIYNKTTGVEKWLKRDPSAYIVVDSDASFLRTVSITVNNQGETLAKPVVAAATAVKTGITNAVDTVENIGSGIFTYGKWILIGVAGLAAVVALSYVANTAKSLKPKSLGDIDVLLFKKPTIKDFRVGKKIAYQDVDGQFTKVGKVEKISNGLIHVGGATYTPDELRLIKK